MSMKCSSLLVYFQALSGRLFPIRLRACWHSHVSCFFASDHGCLEFVGDDHFVGRVLTAGTCCFVLTANTEEMNGRERPL